MNCANYSIKEFMNRPTVQNEKVISTLNSFLPAGLFVMTPMMKGAYVAILALGGAAISAVILEKVLESKGYLKHSKAIAYVFKGLLVIGGSIYMLWALTNNPLIRW